MRRTHPHRRRAEARRPVASAARTTPDAAPPTPTSLTSGIGQFFQQATFDGTKVVSEARRWLGTNPTGLADLWCARFMNFVLERTGHQGSGSDRALSFSSYGQRIAGPRVGAIAVMSRGENGGHVGVVSGIDSSGNPIIISGNYSDTVAESTVPHGDVLAYVQP